MATADSERPADVIIDTSSDASGVPIVTVSGELDMSNADVLKARLELVTAASPARVIFDLRDLRFMDSAGIAVLLTAAETVGAVTLRAPSQAVRRVVELTGLTEVLAIEP
jgi:anti-anti-sigma factor